MKPKLCKSRFRALKSIEACGLKVFTSLQCGVHGAALYILELAGWIERTELPDDLPWEADTRGNYWWLTKEGEHVLRILPSKFLGK